MAATFHIDTLVGDNYSTWKIQMRSVLKEADLWGYVDGSIPKPQTTDDTYAKWLRNDSKAEGKIMLSICKSNYAALDGLESSRAIWEKLKEMHQSKGPARKASLLKKIILTKLQEDGDVRKHISDFSDAVKELSEIGVAINDEVLAIILMYSLPSSFSMFRTAIESRDELPSTAVLKIKIIEEYDGRGNQPAEAGVMYSKSNNKYYDKKRRENDFNRTQGHSQPSENRICYKCGKHGHIAKNCPKKKGKKPYHSSSQVENDAGSSPTTFMVYTAEEALYSKRPNNAWCLDSGCTGHMCNEKQMFREFKQTNSEVTLANNECTRINGMGKVALVADTGQEKHHIDISRVMYVPDLRTNLLSVSAIADRGFKLTFDEKGAVIFDKKGKVWARADRIGNLYYVRQCQEVVNNIEMKSLSRKMIDIWHERLGHVNERDLKSMAKHGLVDGLKISDSDKLSECEVCAREKQACKPFPTGNQERTKDLLEIVHTDVCGPMRHSSVGGKTYFVTFIDDKSRYCQVRFINSKSEVLNVFKSYKAEVETFTGNKIKFLQSDNGLEYVNREFNNFLKIHGIQRRLTVPHTPQQNGIAERMNRTLVEMARCMMRQAGSPPSFWAEAINTASYIRNRCPTSALDGRVPFTVWTGKIPTVKFMQVFGAKVFVKNKNPGKGKFDSRAVPGIFMGYDAQSKAYRVYLPESRKTTVCRDIKFMSETAFRHEYCEILDENVTVDIRESGETEEEPKQTEQEPVKMELDDVEEKPRKILRAKRGPARKMCAIDQVPEDEINEVPKGRKRGATVSWEKIVGPSKRGRGRPRIVRSGSVGRPRKQYASMPIDDGEEGDDDATQSSGEDEVFINLATNTPSCWSEIKHCEDAKAWKEAVEKEIVAQIKNGTWKLVPRPKDRKVIGSRLVLCKKNTNQGEVKKARLVAKGCSQRPGEDFYETYSPVARSTSIRILSALSAELGLDIHQMDVVTAYLNGELEENVFMEVPEMLGETLMKIIEDGDKYSEHIVVTAKRWLSEIRENDDCVCLLIKSLYGLKQSGRQWNKKCSGKLKNLGFEAMPQDPCLFMSRRKNKIMLIAVYVDDMLIATDDSEWLCEVKHELSNEFEMKDLGLASQCLGIEFTRDNEHRVYLTQEKYARSVLEKFGMSECKPMATPMEQNCKLIKREKIDVDFMSKIPYQNAIGALMYLAVTTRPDIAFSVNYLSQFNNNYSNEHWAAIKRVMRYLKGTLGCGIMYERTGLKLFGVVDADWGSCKVDRRSYSGYAFVLGGSPVSWEAHKQRTVALSSTEAEYMAISEATKEALYLSALLESMKMPCECVTLLNDNQGAIKLTENDSFHARTKHIDVRHHFIRDACARGMVELKYLPTSKMPADMLTKGLGKIKHYECMSNLGMLIVNK